MNININKRQVLIMMVLSFIPLVLLSVISTYYLSKALEEEIMHPKPRVGHRSKTSN